MAEVWPTEVLFFVCIPAHVFHTDKIIPPPSSLRPVHSLPPLPPFITSPYTSAYVSALPETPPSSGQQRLQLLLLALGGFAGIQTGLLMCRTFRADCFCLYFHNLSKGFISFKSVSQPAVRLSNHAVATNKAFSHSAVLIKLNFFP